MSLNKRQIVAVYLEIDILKKRINTSIDHNKKATAVRLINRRIMLKKLLKEDITISKFISTIPNETTKQYYTKLLLINRYGKIE